MIKKKHRRKMPVLVPVCAVLIVVLGLVLLYGFFPTPYREAVDNAAERFGVDRALIYAVIKAESNFDPAAVSHAGAKGLAQITDNTAQYVAEMIGVEYGSGDSFDAEKNISLSAAYLRYLLQKYNGDIRLAMAAYNAGEGNVDKWLAEDGEMKDIPFGETKKYVRKVKLYRRIYSILYPI